MPPPPLPAYSSTPCSSREDPWQEQPPPRPAASLPAGRTKPPAPPLPPDTLCGLPVAGFKAAPAHRPPNKAPPPALPPPAESRVPSDSGGSAAWPPPHPPPKAPPAAPDPPAKSPPPDPRSVAFPAPLGRTRVEDPPRAETEATRAQPPPKAPTWTPPPSGVGNLDPVLEGDESALSEDTSPELPVSQGAPVVLGAPQAAPTPPVPVSTLTGPALSAGLSQVTPRALPPFSPGPAGSLQGVISGGPRSDPSADAAAGQHTEAREAASEFSASMGGQPLALAAFPVLSADLDALALLLEGFWLEGEGRAHAACHMIHDGLLVWARDSNPPSTVIPEGRGAFRVAGAGRPEVRGRIMADGNYILIAGYHPGADGSFLQPTLLSWTCGPSTLRVRPYRGPTPCFRPRLSRADPCRASVCPARRPRPIPLRRRQMPARTLMRSRRWLLNAPQSQRQARIPRLTSYRPYSISWPLRVGDP